MSPINGIFMEWLGWCMGLLGQVVIASIPLSLFIAAYRSRVPTVQIIITCLLLAGATFYATLLWWESHFGVELLTFIAGFHVLLASIYSFVLIARFKRKILLLLPVLATMLSAWFLAHLIILSNYSEI